MSIYVQLNFADQFTLLSYYIIFCSIRTVKYCKGSLKCIVLLYYRGECTKCDEGLLEAPPFPDEKFNQLTEAFAKYAVCDYVYSSISRLVLENRLSYFTFGFV